MGAAETTGIVVVTVAIIQGLLKLSEHLVNKYLDGKTETAEDKILNRLISVESKIGTDCGLNEMQSMQLRQLHDVLLRVDADGVPLPYVPRSWMETQKEIVDRLQKITETEYKMLGIIERLERRLEALDSRAVNKGD